MVMILKPCIVVLSGMEKFLWAKGFFQPIEFARTIKIETTKSPRECAEEALRHLAGLAMQMS
ncbi:MAG: hypothetical protein Greene071436_177 [Parcubacteria group bacterium Greene0714_36]|nr:MAG: hypothetical protein Greene071436_177 [Parcubacteria group bacterium Greene0714_36]